MSYLHHSKSRKIQHFDLKKSLVPNGFLITSNPSGFQKIRDYQKNGDRKEKNLSESGEFHIFLSYRLICKHQACLSSARSFKSECEPSQQLFTPFLFIFYGLFIFYTIFSFFVSFPLYLPRYFLVSNSCPFKSAFVLHQPYH